MTAPVFASPEYINSVLAEKRRHAANIRLVREVKLHQRNTKKARTQRRRFRLSPA